MPAPERQVKQAVSFPVAGREVLGVLHLADGEAIGGALVLHGWGGGPDQPHVVATCEALAAAGIATLRFAFRDHEPPTMTLDTALEDAAAALRLLRAHEQVGDRIAAVGFSFGGAVAARVAGRDHRIRGVILAAAPAAFQGDRRSLVEITRTRAKVMLLWGSRDTTVPPTDAERYAAVLSQARVNHRIVTIDGGDHDFAPAAARAAMTEVVAAFVRECLIV